MTFLLSAVFASQLWKTKTPSWGDIDLIRIAGVGIGWKPWQVVEVLGKPFYKSGDMAGNAGATASFDKGNVRVTFERGSVVSITEDGEHVPADRTNILRGESSPEVIVDFYGTPKLISSYPGLDVIGWQYPNGVTYDFYREKLSSVTLSKVVYDYFKRHDWGIVISETKGTTTTSQGDVLGSRVKGIVRNNRQVPVKVQLRVRWTLSPSDKVADLFDSQVYEIAPQDSVIFQESGGPFVASSGKLMYLVLVKSVTELN
jgi:hypothetical protein